MMIHIQNALDGIGGEEKLTHEELADALATLAPFRGAFSEDVLQAIDHIVDDLLRYKYPERVAAVHQKRKEGKVWP